MGVFVADEPLPEELLSPLLPWLPEVDSLLEPPVVADAVFVS